MPPGGGSDGYDRDYISTEGQYSMTSAQILSQNTELHKSCDPKQFIDEDEKIICEHKSPIILALDVTGSMNDWPKVIYDKLPVFYGQIIQQGYLDDPSISFSAIGDASASNTPIQVTPFGQGKQVDELISKICLQQLGGGNLKESYDLAAYFYAYNCDISKSELPFLFFTGDEGLYDDLSSDWIEKYLGLKDKDRKVSEIFEDLTKKFNVFLLHKPFQGWHGWEDDSFIEQWSNCIGKENILTFSTAKAVIDVMLGAIAITSKKRTLKEYVKDMKNRKQDEERIEEVSKSLSELSKSMDTKKIVKN
eukprot:gene2144-2010_t